MPDILIEPKDCALVLVGQQAGLAFSVGIDCPMLLNSVIASSRFATVFGMPIVEFTSAARSTAVADARESRPDSRGGRDRPPQHEYLG